MIVKVKRQDNKDSSPYYQSFEYKVEGIKTVAGILDDLNYLDDLVDINGVTCRRISWECSCMQKICGSCAIVVNHEPCLACSKFIDTSKTKELLLEPLTKFPVLCDLMVDRSIILEYQKIAKLYIEKNSEIKNIKNEQNHLYEVSKCLKCGLCLEVCPNYKKDGKQFFGALFANEAYLDYVLNSEKKDEILDQYQEHFIPGCSKAMSCHSICPAHMPTLSSISYMNKSTKIAFKK